VSVIQNFTVCRLNIVFRKIRLIFLFFLISCFSDRKLLAVVFQFVVNYSWSAPSLLSGGYRGLFPLGKLPGA